MAYEYLTTLTLQALFALGAGIDPPPGCRGPDGVWRMRTVKSALVYAASPAVPNVPAVACLREYARTIASPRQYEDVSRILQIAMERDPDLATYLAFELWSREVDWIRHEVVLWFQAQVGRLGTRKIQRTERDPRVIQFLREMREEFGVESTFAMCLRALTARGPFH